MTRADLMIRNAREIVTPLGSGPSLGTTMRELCVIPDGWLAARDGTILAVGREDQVAAYQGEDTRVIDASEHVVLPGWIDCHTHTLFAGTREHEWVQKLAGKTYLEILQGGGGILDTVRATRAADPDELKQIGWGYLNAMATHGTTTVEIKSGYGLTVTDELKMLRVINTLNREHPLDLVSTFLGAHAIPPEMKRTRYVDLVVREMLPAVASWAQFCDVFCEEGAFTVKESEKILRAGLDHALTPKIHAGEFNALGGAGLVAKLNGISADHLDQVTDEEIEAMADKGVVAVFLPPVNFYLGSATYPDARRFIDRQVPLAIATDFNPGSAPTYSMPFVISLACLYLRLHPAEAITAATLNAACAIGMADRTGSLEVGKQADLILIRVPNHLAIPYFFAVNRVETVIKKGRIIMQRPSRLIVPTAESDGRGWF